MRNDFFNMKVSQNDKDEIKTSLERLSEVAISYKRLSILDESDSNIAYRAIESLVESAQLILQSVSATCTIQNPPSSIQVFTDHNGNLYYTCSHQPSHRWSLSGERIE
jgi:hypothetical protein